MDAYLGFDELVEALDGFRLRGQISGETFHDRNLHVHYQGQLS